MVKTVSEYLDRISAIGRLGEHVFFRGHSDASWRLQPAIFRRELGLQKQEQKIFGDLLAARPDDFRRMTSCVEKLSHAQHNGLPTRLLDVTSNALVGLYFAVEDDGEGTADGSVVRISCDETRIKSFDSDALSCVANLSRLEHDEREEIKEWISEKRSEYGSVAKIPRREFSDLSSVKRLVQFVRQEKPYFEGKIQPISLYSFFLLRPAMSHPRVAAQSGAFLASGGLRGLRRSDKISEEKIIIPYSSKSTIRRELYYMGISRMSMFPDLENAARFISKIRPNMKL